MDIKFREAKLQDAETILNFEKSVSSLTYHSQTTINDVIDNYLKKGHLYLILANSKTIGVISYELMESCHAHINALIVSPKYQNQGIASKALEFILERLKGMETIDLITHPKNAPALKLYSKYGFKIIGQKDNYYGDDEPRLILTKSINKKF